MNFSCLNNYSNYFNNLVYLKLENIYMLFFDFLISGELRLYLIFLIIFINFNKIFNILKKLFSHEKSKKLFFYLYILTVSLILSQCLILVSSNTTESSDQGILLLYVYVSATLMLFLIYLALTTCESYLNKELETTNINKYKRWDLFLTDSTLYIFPIFMYYYYCLSEIAESYYIKSSIVLNFNNNIIDSNKNSTSIMIVKNDKNV